MNAAFAELKQRLAETHDLAKAMAVLGWDQRTMMPRLGGEARAGQLATVGKIHHELFTSDEVGRLLEGLRPYEESLPYDSDEASLIRVTRRDWEKERRVPAELAGEILREGSRGQAAWLAAKQASDFSLFLPALRKVTELALRYAECFDAGDSPYDAFLDDYEPGMKTAEVKAVFDVLRPELTAIVREAGPPADDSFLHGDFPVARQEAFLRDLLPAFGFADGAWRLDPTVHPFCTSFSPRDVRMTTRYSPAGVRALFASMHEAGHGLYAHGLGPSLERSPLARSPSLGLDESQSRTWENLVGRSRPFWERYYGPLQETFPEQLAGVGLDDYLRAINRVVPSLIRVDADEVTYSLHIILRFELEQEIVSSTLALEDLPEAWREKSRELLGIVPETDAEGVLQDVHWSRGGYGYFPTYALGNVISLQLWRRIQHDLRGLDDQLAAGDFHQLHGWLQERLYRHGRKFTPKETLERVLGSGDLDPQPFLEYLREKVQVYQPA
jgi:carboxypeptidase Taq